MKRIGLLIGVLALLIGGTAFAASPGDAVTIPVTITGFADKAVFLYVQDLINSQEMLALGIFIQTYQEKHPSKVRTIEAGTKATVAEELSPEAGRIRLSDGTMWYIR